MFYSGTKYFNIKALVFDVAAKIRFTTDVSCYSQQLLSLQEIYMRNKVQIV